LCCLSRLSPLPAACIALVAGAVNVFSFAPFGYWPLQLLTLALLFHLVLCAPSIKRSIGIGWAFGFGWLISGIYWLYISMHDYGGMPAAMAALAVILLAGALAVFTALVSGGASWFRQTRNAPDWCLALLILPAMWALSEWVRGWIFTGFPWIVSGYAHSHSPFAGFAPLLGVYGVGWLVAATAGCLVLMTRGKAVALKAGALLVTLVIVGAILHTIRWTSPNGAPISVRLLQGNVPQEMKFDEERTADTLTMYEDMIKEAPADLIATPETALPLLAHQLPVDYLPRLAEFATASSSHLIIGVPISDGPQQYTNSVIGLAPSTAQHGVPHAYRYDKHHLVPFGEFIPLGFRWFVDMMHIPLGDFTRGAAIQAPFGVKDQWVMPNICYEDLFGEEIVNQLRAAYLADKPVASILLNVSNIAWFGDSIALPQHLQISQMRAIETGRPMLRATNTGATAVIDADGKVLAQLPAFTRAALTTSVQGYRGLTPYIAGGNLPLIAFILLSLIAAWLLTRKKQAAR